ncbi:MAG: hypothetical protein ACQESR_19755 [Planctomycetota bacterium]
MESCPTQAVLPLVGLAAENVIRDRYNAITRISRHPTSDSRRPPNDPFPRGS